MVCVSDEIPMNSNTGDKNDIQIDIDRIDRELVRLINQRAELAIAQARSQHGLR